MGPQATTAFADWLAAAVITSPDGEELSEEQEARLRSQLGFQYQQQFSIAMQKGNARAILDGARAARDRLGQRVYCKRNDSNLDVGE